MIPVILKLDFDGLCDDFNAAISAIVEQGMFIDGPTLLDKTLTHSEGKKELEIPVAFQIPLDVPATYLRPAPCKIS